MKNLFILFILVGALQHAYAQKIPDYSHLKDGTNEQNRARANEVAFQAANYILAMPPDTNNKDIVEAGTFLIAWMTATPDYTFSLDKSLLDLHGEHTGLLRVLLAAMTEFEMNNTTEKDDEQKVRLHAARKLISYAQTPANKVKMPDILRKAAEAEKKGKLEKYLESLEKE